LGSFSDYIKMEWFVSEILRGRHTTLLIFRVDSVSVTPCYRAVGPLFMPFLCSRRMLTGLGHESKFLPAFFPWQGRRLSPPFSPVVLSI